MVQIPTKITPYISFGKVQGNCTKYEHLCAAPHLVTFQHACKPYSTKKETINSLNVFETVPFTKIKSF